MDGQETATEGAAPQVSESAPAAPNTELEALKKELAAARKEAAKYRTRNDEETAAKLREQGDYKALYEKEAPDRQLHKEMREYLEAQLDATGAEELPDYLRTALDAMPSVVGKVKLIQQYRSSQASGKPPPVKQAQVPTGAPPAAPPAVDTFDRVAGDSAALRKAREADPKGFEAWVAKQRGPQQPQTTWARMQAALGKK